MCKRRDIDEDKPEFSFDLPNVQDGHKHDPRGDGKLPKSCHLTTVRFRGTFGNVAMQRKHSDQLVHKLKCQSDVNMHEIHSHRATHGKHTNAKATKQSRNVKHGHTNSSSLNSRPNSEGYGTNRHGRLTSLVVEDKWGKESAKCGSYTKETVDKSSLNIYLSLRFWYAVYK